MLAHQAGGILEAWQWLRGRLQQVAAKIGNDKVQNTFQIDDITWAGGRGGSREPDALEKEVRRGISMGLPE